MKRIVLTLTFALVAVCFCYAQKIEVEKVFGGYKYTQAGEVITMRDMVKTMEPYAQAYELVKKARTNNTLATVLGGAGGAFVGFPLGQAMGGGDANWTLAGIGLGLVALSIPLSSGTNKNLQQAVELYNASLSAPSSYHFNPKFELTAVENRIGIVMIF